MAEGTHANNVGLPPEKIAASRPNRRSSLVARQIEVRFLRVQHLSHGVTTIGLDSSDPTSLDAHDPRGAGEVEGDVLKCARLDIQDGELEIPPGALLSHSNHLNHSRSEPANKPRVPRISLRCTD
jgi:hypothetical protein